MAARPVIQAMASILPELAKNVNPNLVKNIATAAGTIAATVALSGGKSGGNKSGNGSDDGEDDDFLDRIMKEAPCIYRSEDNRKYYQSKDGNKWYSKDLAGHGGSKGKVYKNKGQTLELEGSIDEKGRLIDGKHESGKFQTIRKKDLIHVKGKEI
ncbi:uncharacterized protein LOC134681279 [Mytilus trossulus]|uniref:uncharacterized protein LOC134681279 n=1 Tax=Mytilus trossulus TaxID=6551 RepID=UPI003007D3D0